LLLQAGMLAQCENSCLPCNRAMNESRKYRLCGPFSFLSRLFGCTAQHLFAPNPALIMEVRDISMRLLLKRW
jgi:hypothetical protein